MGAQTNKQKSQENNEWTKWEYKEGNYKKELSRSSGVKEYHNWIERFSSGIQQQAWLNIGKNRETQRYVIWNYQIRGVKRNTTQQQKVNNPIKKWAKDLYWHFLQGR